MIVKKTKKCNRKITSFLRDRISHYDHGIKTYKGQVVHCNTNQTTIGFLNYKFSIAHLTVEKFYDHFSGRRTYYYAGNASSKANETLGMIDIDCHKSGSLAGAIAFVEKIKAEYGWGSLFYEKSTNGNGIHAYFVLEKTVLGRKPSTAC
jgi:hypothetical protein